MEKSDSVIRNKLEIRTGLIFALMFALFLIVIVSIVWFTTRTNILTQSRIEHQNELNSMRNEIFDNMSRLESHIVYLSNLKAIRDYLENENPQDRKEVEDMFTSIIEYNTRPGFPIFDQIRILDMEGMERIRVNLGPRSQAYAVEEKELQDKSSRYYYTETLKLDGNSVFISSLDLNVEDGHIEIPLKPVLRISRIIYGQDGEPLGMIVMNHQFRMVYREINNVKMSPQNSWFLLNSEGYYLYHRNEARTFGFMEGRAGESSFSNDYPDIWADIISGETGIAEDREGFFYSIAFNPLKGSVFKPQEPMNWYMLILKPMESIKADFLLLNSSIVAALVLLLPMLMLIGFLLGRSTSRNKWYLKQLEESATHDEMTGLLNHQAVLDRLGYLINLTIRRTEPLCVAFIDLNDLKKINDSMGHKKGDLLIQTMARSLKSLLRNTDVGARIGGDEFLVIFPGLSMENTAKVMDRISSDFSARGESIFLRTITFSWGTAQWGSNDDTVEKFIARADDAMYEMKRKMKESR